MKFVFDFDGVMTSQIEEANRVNEIFVNTLSKVSPLAQNEFESLINAHFNEMIKTPAQHGWQSENQISAYGNEDIFIQNVALAQSLMAPPQYLLHQTSILSEALKSATSQNFLELSHSAYQQVVKETLAKKHAPIDPKMKPLFESLLGLGHELVVISNSSTDRILDLLEGDGLAAFDHNANPTASLRIRGQAKKFELTANSSFFDVGEYRVYTNRPHYLRLLNEERPQVVVGDVFTLDLALPFYLSQTQPEVFKNMSLFLREQPYTPKWSKDFFKDTSATNAKLYVINDLFQIPECLKMPIS